MEKVKAYCFKSIGIDIWQYSIDGYLFNQMEVNKNDISIVEFVVDVWYDVFINSEKSIILSDKTFLTESSLNFKIYTIEEYRNLKLNEILK